MARYEDMILTTSLVSAGQWLAVSQSVVSSMISLVKIKVVPNTVGGTSGFQIYKRGTFLEVDKLYDTRSFTGSLIDPVEDYSDPMTDTPGATAERNEGSPIPYEDDDAGNKLHFRVLNGDVNSKTFTITIRYEVPALIVAGSILTVPSLTVQGDLNIQQTMPILTFTDTTAGAKGFKILVDGNFADLIEKAEAGASLLRLDLVNHRIGLGATPISQLSNTASNIIGTEGIGVAGLAIAWRISDVGWAAAIDNTSAVTNASGLLVKTASITSYIAKFDSAGLERFSVFGNGRVHIGTTSTGTGLLTLSEPAGDVVLRIDRNTAAPAGAMVQIVRNSASDNSPILELYNYAGSSPPNGDFALYYLGTLRWTLYGGPIYSALDGFNVDLGAGNSGARVTVGCNTNASQPAAGSVNLVRMNGVSSYVWSDAAGILRLWGNQPTYSTDTSGVIVGSQTSSPASKTPPMPVTPDETTAIVSRIFHAPLFTYEMTNEIEAGYVGLKHLGFMSNNQPMWMRYDAASIDEHRISMEILVALQELAKFVNFTPAPPVGDPAGVGRFINGEPGATERSGG